MRNVVQIQDVNISLYIFSHRGPCLEQVVPFMCASKRTYSTSLNQASAHRQVSNEEGNHAENKSDNTSGEPQNPTSNLTFVSLWTSRLDDHSLKSDAYLLPLEESDSAGSPDSRLNYFAIDCRSSYERRLGRFPKVRPYAPRMGGGRRHF